MRRTDRLLFCTVFIVAFFTHSNAQSYRITDLGALKGNNESNGFWINSSGQVVGCSDIQTAEGYPCTGTVFGQRAFLWTPGKGMQNLGTLAGGNISAALGINDSGEVVGYSNIKGLPVIDFIAFLWTSTRKMVSLGTLSGGNSSCAFSINLSGEIAGDSFNSAGIVDATSWTNKRIRNLGSLPSAIFTAGLGLNDSGEVVGESVFSYGPPFTSHAFKTTSLGMTDLGTLPGGVTSMANAVNSSRTVVGQSDGTATAGNWHAVMWDIVGNIQDLGTLPGGTYSIAFGVNDSNVVVGYGNIADNAAHALIWTEKNGMQDLNSLIPTNSGWVLINANAVNILGQITGYGSIHGHNHAFLLTPR